MRLQAAFLLAVLVVGSAGSVGPGAGLRSPSHEFDFRRCDASVLREKGLWDTYSSGRARASATGADCLPLGGVVLGGGGAVSMWLPPSHPSGEAGGFSFELFARSEMSARAAPAVVAELALGTTDEAAPSPPGQVMGDEGANFGRLNLTTASGGGWMAGAWTHTILAVGVDGAPALFLNGVQLAQWCNAGGEEAAAFAAGSPLRLRLAGGGPPGAAFRGTVAFARVWRGLAVGADQAAALHEHARESLGVAAGDEAAASVEAAAEAAAAAAATSAAAAAGAAAAIAEGMAGESAATNPDGDSGSGIPQNSSATSGNDAVFPPPSPGALAAAAAEAVAEEDECVVGVCLTGAVRSMATASVQRAFKQVGVGSRRGAGGGQKKYTLLFLP